jgi:hypothetical protein
MAPMGRLTLNGATADAEYQKSLDTFSRRHHLRLWEQRLRDHQGERIVEAAGVAALCDAVRSTACFAIAVRLAGCALELVRRQPCEWRLSAPDADWQMLTTMSAAERGR